MSTLPSLLRLFLPRHLAAPVAAVLLMASVSAQTTPSSSNTTVSTQAEAKQGIGMVLVASYEHAFSANLKNGSTGQLATDRFSIGGQQTSDLFGGQLVSNAGYSFTNYDFSGSPAAFGGVNRLGASWYYTHPVQGDWGAFGFISGSVAAQSSTSLSDGGQVALALGPTYKVNDDLTIAAGPMYYSRIEDDATWTLMADATWKFLPQWELHAYAGISNGVTITYDLFNDHQTVLFSTGEYNSRWMRLSPTAAGHQAVNESETVIKVGVRQIFGGHYFVRAYISALLSREYQFHTNGNSSNSFDVDNTLGVGVELGMAL